MNLKIQKVLKDSIVQSRVKFAFSTPKEITRFVNAVLEENYPTKAISKELAEMSWAYSAKSRAARKHGPMFSESVAYYFTDGDRSKKAILIPDAQDKLEKILPLESLSDTEKRFRRARADKEEYLALIRKTESQTTKMRQKEIDLELKLKMKEFVSVDIIQRELNIFLVELKAQFDSLPLKVGQRFASITDELEIQTLMLTETNRILSKMSSFDPAGKPKLPS